MQIDLKYKIIIAVVALAVSFAVGRYTVPEKVKIETKVVQVEKQDTDKDTHKKTIVTVVQKPNGEKDSTTTTTVDVVSKTDSIISDKSDTTKQITKGSSTTLSLLGGYNLNNNTPTYGLSVTKPVLGPVTIGAFGLNNGTVGASVGLTF